jgi:hypothetical protein
MINRIITALCFAVMLVEVLVVIIKFARRFKDRTKFIAYLRSFNQGKCALIYVTAYPLYIIGALSSGTDPFNAVFGSISKIINLVVLQYDTSSISVLLENDGFYRGCASRVGLYNAKTGKKVYINSQNPEINPKSDPSPYHLDPHPRFNAKEKYITFTTAVYGRPEVAIAKTEDIVELTE